MRNRTFGDVIFESFNYVFMIIIGIVTFFPFLYIVSYSLSDPNKLTGGLLLFPAGFSLDAYKIAFSDPAILKGIGISFLRTTIGPAVMVFFTSMAAYCLTREEFMGVKFFRKFFVFTMYFSSGLIPLYILAVNLKLSGTFWIYIIPLSVSVFNMVLIKTFIESLPKSLEEAARVDGANDFVLFWRVIFPICSPVIAAVVLFTAVMQWNMFIDTEIYNAMNPELFTLQYILYQTLSTTTNMENSKELINHITPQGLKMAITVITVLPILFLYPFLQRYLAKGLMVGSIKG
ncbi:carbohydrate ABC transporter permease [Bacillus infantis]|uniref:carbohydrate ABC transporter permease n=1 Tax=Bacillus infantis TaxID=324767 RepID=UPI00101D1F4C|nr:carbohydrate ABC transporter permease [Bacillus infantis]RYI30394.1 carbohydrate ABC transporter permease [Bacillus infantis]